MKGLGHLWFLTAIAICYLTTPLLQLTKKYARYLLWVVLTCQIVIELFIPSYGWKASWVILYAIGYYLANVGRKSKLLLAVVCMFALVWCLPNLSYGILKSVGEVYSVVFRFSIGVIVFLLFLSVFELLNRYIALKIPQAIRIFDKYSFQVYIVHHSFIMPPFGLLHISSSIVLNVLIAMIYIVFATIALTILSDRIVGILPEKLNLKILTYKQVKE